MPSPRPSETMSREEELLALIEDQRKDMKLGSMQPFESHVIGSLDAVFRSSKGTNPHTFAELLDTEGNLRCDY